MGVVSAGTVPVDVAPAGTVPVDVVSDGTVPVGVVSIGTVPVDAVSAGATVPGWAAAAPFSLPEDVPAFPEESFVVLLVCVPSRW